MSRKAKIITVVLCPTWDITCLVDGITWGEHKQVLSTTNYPAGKALNVSKALAWMGETSIAAGLWGRDDEEQMLSAMRGNKKIELRFTAVAGHTRQNVTVADIANVRQMHLRAPSELATKKTLALLHSDLGKIACAQSICVFAGSMPGGELLGEVKSIIKSCRDKGAAVVVDSSGAGLKAAVEQGGLLLIKPNTEELEELCGYKIKNTVSALTKAAQGLLGKTEAVVVSRGEKGAIVVTREAVFAGWSLKKREAVNTVACGDYMLAGFLRGLVKNAGIKDALKSGLVAATAKAWGLENSLSFAAAEKKIAIELQQVS